MRTNSQDQEIDLGQIGKGITNFFQGAINSFFKFLYFLKKKLIVLIILGLIFYAMQIMEFLALHNRAMAD